MKLVLILVLMIVSVMAVVGTFLINSVSTFYIDSFYTQMQSVFTTDTIRSMQEAAAAPDAEGLKTIIDAHRSRLGIDDYRNYYILDGEGRFVDGSNPNLSVTRTRNIIAAMAGEAGTRSSVSDSVMDIAVPLDHDGNGTVDYIVYIADDKQEISDLSWRFFQIVMQAMMFGLLAAILLSFLLSKTITTPIERITEGARSIAEGNFDQDLGVQSSDEIGELTRSFNYMARRLKTTVGEVQGERDKLNTLFLHMTDGVAAFTTDGRLIHMNPATENLLGVISSESERMARIVTDLLTLSRLDYGRMELRMTRFSLSALLHKVADAMKFTAEDSGHELTVDAPDSLPEIAGDRERIEQVVVNILSNAVKYTPSGGHIRLAACEGEKNTVRITVQDDGIGIPAEDVPRLFERFYRVDKARSRAAGGTGLGLAIAKEIVEKHGGHIELASEYGTGTTVHITLPTDLAPDEKEGRA